MKILSLNIVEYAFMKDKKIDFSSGLNIIEGENESGKSSILSFIKFMLYGFPKKGPRDAVSEKDKGYSWERGAAEGSMVIETSEGKFRIERSAREGFRDRLSIIDVATGAPVHKGEVPGEVFLGVSLSVFESSACVKQLESSVIDGKDVGSALQNLLLSADESMNTEKAVSKIDDIRRKLLHKTKRGGSVYDLTCERDALREKLSAANRKNMQIMDYEASFESASALCAELRTKLERTTRLTKAQEKKQQLIIFDSLHSAEARVGAIKNEIEQFKATECKNGFVPGAEYLKDLALAERDRAALCKEISIKEEAIAAEKRSITSGDGKGAELVQKIEDMGGALEISERYRNSKKKKGGRLAVGIIALIVALGCLALALPAILGRSVTLEPSALYLLIAIICVFAGVSVFGFVSSASEGKKAKEIVSEFSLPRKTSEKELYRYLDSCVRAKEEREDLFEALERKEREQRSLLSSLAALDTRLGELLSRVGEEFPEGADGADITAAVARATERAEALAGKLEALSLDLEKYDAIRREREKDTEGLDEAYLRRSLTPELEEELKGINVSVLHRDHDYLKAQTEAAEKRRYFFDTELIGLRATAENPLAIEKQLRKTEKLLSEQTRAHDALELASETILAASDAMKKNVTPRLRSVAGATMNAFTSGKYSELGLDSDFAVTVVAAGGTHPIDAMSSGTRDAAYLSVRLALISVLYREEDPPLLLDEILSQIDDKRAAAVLQMLSSYCDGEKQCLLFSCHTREASMINANVIKL